MASPRAHLCCSSAYGLANLAALGPYISQVGADTLFVLNSGDILTLKNVDSGTLVANDFQFV